MVFWIVQAVYEYKKIKTNEKTFALTRREWKANSMAITRESNKQHTGNDPNPHRQHCEDLRRLLRWRWIEAPHYILIKQSHCCKNQHRQKGVDKIKHGQSKVRCFFGREQLRTIRCVDDPQPLSGGKPVMDIPICIPEAICKWRKKTGHTAEGDEACCHVLAGGVALTLVGEDGREELECEHGPCGEEVGQMGCALECLVDDLKY